MGQLTILRAFPSPTEGFSRTLRIFTPAAYEREPRQRFGVIYLQDGQNVFAHPESARFPTWSANLALERLSDEGRIGPWLMVGVDHAAGRFEDYSPWDEPRAHVKARGEQYARFLVEHLKPFIDANFRTHPGPGSTAVVGSSLGGLISLYAGWRYPDLFGRIGALSPTVMWSGDGLFHFWREHTGRPTRLYLDAGEHERFDVGTFPLDYGRGVLDFYLHLKRLGYREDELCLVLEPGGQHTEGDWARRLPYALKWLLS
jgi:predicted alpha/beta superfamily hydrolase